MSQYIDTQKRSAAFTRAEAKSHEPCAPTRMEYPINLEVGKSPYRRPMSKNYIVTEHHQRRRAQCQCNALRIVYLPRNHVRGCSNLESQTQPCEFLKCTDSTRNVSVLAHSTPTILHHELTILGSNPFTVYTIPFFYRKICTHATREPP